jgi:hypothetical protein
MTTLPLIQAAAAAPSPTGAVGWVWLAVALPLVGFLVNGWLLQLVSVKRLYSVGMLLSGVSMVVMMSLNELSLVGLGVAGLLMGMSFGLYWSNRDYLALSSTSDDNRNYYYGLETFFATNIGTVYAPNSPVDVNGTITRVAPTDPVSRASKALTASPQVRGRPRVPVLTLHDIGDLFVPFSMEQFYAASTTAHHRSQLVVQRAIRADGHCEFSPNEVGRAWDDLVAWEHTGVRPAGDAVADPPTVSDPNFGCSFTDKTAYFTGTRPLFAPCP